MKTYEFIDAVKRMGYQVDDFFNIDVKKDGETLITVWKNKINAVSSWQSDGAIDQELFDLAIEYARTPIEQRKYQLPDYVEYDGYGFYVGRKYHMARHGEHVIAELAFGANICENQPTAFSTMPGLRGPAAMFAMRDTPDSYGFYWKCEPTENYDTREIQFTDLLRSTFLEDSPFDDDKTKPEYELYSEVTTDTQVITAASTDNKPPQT